jgi:hypothetical protein
MKMNDFLLRRTTVSTILSATYEEKFHTVGEICKLLRKSTSWVSREFRNYPGVIRSGKRRLGKRPYVTLLIPELVLQRWIREHTAAGPTEKHPLLDTTIEP